MLLRPALGACETGQEIGNPGVTKTPLGKRRHDPVSYADSADAEVDIIDLDAAPASDNADLLFHPNLTVEIDDMGSFVQFNGGMELYSREEVDDMMDSPDLEGKFVYVLWSVGEDGGKKQCWLFAKLTSWCLTSAGVPMK